jgi:putative salt-induced outer membrane protein
MRFVGLVVLGVLLAVPAAGVAQEAAPAAPAPPPPPPRVEGSGEFAFVNSNGNADSTSLGVRGELIYRPDPWLVRTRAAWVRLESDTALEAQSFVYLFRGQRRLSPRLSAYGQYDYLRDLFAGLAHKNVVSGGLSYKAVENARHELVLDGGLGMSNERRTLGEDVTTAVLMGGLGYKLKVSETRYEQSLSRGEDWRFDNALSLAAKISTVFSLKVSHVIRYANEPVEGFETTDMITSAALVAKF